MPCNREACSPNVFFFFFTHSITFDPFVLFLTLRSSWTTVPRLWWGFASDGRQAHHPRREQPYASVHRQWRQPGPHHRMVPGGQGGHGHQQGGWKGGFQDVRGVGRNWWGLIKVEFETISKWNFMFRKPVFFFLYLFITCLFVSNFRSNAFRQIESKWRGVEQQFITISNITIRRVDKSLHNATVACLVSQPALPAPVPVPLRLNIQCNYLIKLHGSVIANRYLTTPHELPLR